jgi:hypothetical protein
MLGPLVELAPQKLDQPGALLQIITHHRQDPSDFKLLMVRRTVKHFASVVLMPPPPSNKRNLLNIRRCDL